jgi:hypothetical protein
MRANLLFFVAVAAAILGLAFRTSADDWTRWYSLTAGGHELIASTGAFLLGLAVVLFGVLAHRWLFRKDEGCRPPERQEAGAR